MIDTKKIKTLLEMQICAVHGEHPKVTFIKDKLNIEACCDDFCQIVAKVNETEMLNQLSNLFTKTIKIGGK